MREDERPPQGLAGLADWRLSGRLSRMLRAGLVSGASGDALLTPPGAKLRFQKLFLFGLGPGGQGEDALSGRVSDALHRLAQAGVHDAALQLPGDLPDERGIRSLVQETPAPARALVFTLDPSKMIRALSRVASGSAPPPERKPEAPCVPPKSRPPPGPPQRYVPPPPKPKKKD